MADVLIVEDDFMDAELTVTALHALPNPPRIHVVHDGQEAIDFLTSAIGQGELALPKVIFLDLHLPHMSGLRALDAIKQNEALRAIPVVMLTSSNHESDITSCYQTGANAYVVKPVDYLEFSQKVQKLGEFWVNTNRPPIAQ